MLCHQAVQGSVTGNADRNMIGAVPGMKESPKACFLGEPPSVESVTAVASPGVRMIRNEIRFDNNLFGG